MRWSDFRHDGISYDLSHLHPCTLEYERPQSGDKLAFKFTVDVNYSLHCFSHAPKNQKFDQGMVYPASELRIFDQHRYEMSKRLPRIIVGLPKRSVRQTGRGNFITVEILGENGLSAEYDVFFKVRKTGKGRVELRVESAYVRDPEYGSNRPSGKKIGFLVILHNVLNSLTIRS